MYNIQNNLNTMNAINSQDKDLQNTQRFMDNLKRRFDPMYDRRNVDSLNFGSSDDVSMGPRKHQNQYSMRKRSIPNSHLRAESITKALQGNVSADKRSKDHLYRLNDKSLFSNNPTSRSPNREKCTHNPYKTNLKETLLKTS